MDQRIRVLFDELAELPAAEREKIFAERRIDPGLRAEVESLLRFNATERRLLTDCVSSAAEETLLSDEAAGGARCGPYRLVRLLGSGGMGDVYLGERDDGEIRQQVAIKFLRPRADRPAWRDRFLKERQLLASLNHPAIARVIDAGGAGDRRPYLVMEYVEGVPLDDYCQKLEFREQLKLCLRVCDTISYAHRNLVIHRDLKPSNILVDASGQPKLLDFGIARILDESADSSMTQERILTPDYASPEQIRGTAHTTATDVYSLGAVMYRLLTGKAPHAPSAGSAEPIEARICSAEVPPASRVNAALPKDLDFILGKAMRKEPEERYPSVDALAEDLRALLDSRPVRARSGSTWYRARKFLRRHWVPVAAAGLAITGLTAGLYVANRQRALAERRFSQLRVLASRVLEVDRTLGRVQADLTARREMVQASLEYLKGLAETARGDLDLSREVARGYYRVGHIQGSPVSVNLGEPKQAEANLAIAEQWIERVLAARPSDPAALAFGVVIAEDRRYIAAAENRIQDKERLRALEEARIDAWIRSKEPKEPPQVRAVGIALHNLADERMDARQYAEAEVLVDRGEEVARQSKFEENAVMLRAMRARIQRFRGDLDSALKTVESIPPQPPPGDAFYSLNLLKAQILGEDRGISLGRTTEAIALWENIFAEFQKRAREDPKDARVRERAAFVALELGFVLWRVNPVRALEIYGAALQGLAELPPSRFRIERRAHLLAGSANALRKLGRIVPASDRVREAMRAAEEAKTIPAEKVELNSPAFDILEAQAMDAQATGDRKRFQALYEDLLRRVEAGKPDILGDLSIVPRMSALYEALGLEDRRLELWQHWNQRLPGNPFVQKQLAQAAQKTVR